MFPLSLGVDAGRQVPRNSHRRGIQGYSVLLNAKVSLVILKDVDPIMENM